MEVRARSPTSATTPRGSKPHGATRRRHRPLDARTRPQRPRPRRFRAAHALLFRPRAALRVAHGKRDAVAVRTSRTAASAVGTRLAPTETRRGIVAHRPRAVARRDEKRVEIRQSIGGEEAPDEIRRGGQRDVSPRDERDGGVRELAAHASVRAAASTAGEPELRHRRETAPAEPFSAAARPDGGVSAKSSAAARASASRPPSLVKTSTDGDDGARGGKPRGTRETKSGASTSSYSIGGCRHLRRDVSRKLSPPSSTPRDPRSTTQTPTPGKEAAARGISARTTSPSRHTAHDVTRRPLRRRRRR